MRYASDEVQALAIVDDNHLPYVSVPVTGGTPYSAEDIDAFIVALPEKVFYPADAVDRLAPTLFKLGALVGLPPQDQTIIRYFITTGSALRHFVRERESEFDPKLVATIMTLPFAQFIWVVEFATEAQWVAGQIAARAVIDATGQTQALVFNRLTVSLDLQTGIRALQLADMGHAGFTRMDQNLRPTQTK
jgi:hypothetical protein